MTRLERLDPVRAWLAAVAALLLGLVGGSLVFPRQVYDRFIWQYFWGPVVADANGVGPRGCAVLHDGSVSFSSTTTACSAAIERGAVTAQPGYTLVSEAGYAITLLLAVIGVVFLLRRLDVGRSRSFFFALVPFMFLGGALRVVEDANDAVPAGVEAAISYPLNTLLISPVIYVTVFVFTLAALLGSVQLERSGRVADSNRPLALIGAAGLVITLVYLFFLATTTRFVTFHPILPAVVILGASAITAATWWAIDRYEPTLHEGTGLMGAVVLWAHSLDGLANVIMTDWLGALGVPGNYVPKHPLNDILVALASAIIPASVLEVTGDAWPFLVVKILAAVFVLYIFDRTILEESPRFSILMLVAIVAVGLGPGTRDLLRATFGI